MSWCDAIPRVRRPRLGRAFVLTSGALLVSCGFQPLYGSLEDRPATPLESVQIATIPDRQGQILRNRLNVLFNPSGAAAESRYRLAVKLATTDSETLIRKDTTATRRDQAIVAIFTLTSLDDQKIVTRGQAKSVSGFDIVESDYATLNAEKDATEANLETIARSIQTQLALFLRRSAEGLPVRTDTVPEKPGTPVPWDPPRGRLPKP